MFFGLLCIRSIGVSRIIAAGRLTRQLHRRSPHGLLTGGRQNQAQSNSAQRKLSQSSQHRFPLRLDEQSAARASTRTEKAVFSDRSSSLCSSLSRWLNKKRGPSLLVAPGPSLDRSKVSAAIETEYR